MDTKLLLIDADAIGYACNAVGDRMHNNEGMEVQGVLKMLQSIRARLRDFPGYLPIVLWDGNSTFRKSILLEYKSTRFDEPEKLALKVSYKKQVPFIQKVLHCSGLIQANHPLAEADDLIFQISRKTEMAGIKTVILSSDSDLFQCVSENTVFVHSKANKDGERRVVDLENFLEETGFANPHAYIQGKAISGDDTDDIDGVKGIAMKTAVKISASHGSVMDFFRDIDQGLYTPKGVIQTRLNEEGRKIFEQNMQLMDLSRAPEFLTQTRFSRRGQPSLQTCMETLGELNLLGHIKPAFFEVFDSVADLSSRQAGALQALLRESPAKTEGGDERPLAGVRIESEASRHVAHRTP